MVAHGLIWSSLIKKYMNPTTLYFTIVQAPPLAPTLSSSVLLRLSIYTALCGAANLLVACLAVVCSTWSAVNQATSGRTVLLPGGLFFHRSIAAANKMVSRTMVELKLRVLMLMMLRGGLSRHSLTKGLF